MSAPGPAIAIVDDDPSVRRGLERLLRSAGYRVETFSSAGEFLARGASVAPACLVLDVTMPGQSGLHLQEDLLAAGRDLPVIFITGQGDAVAAERAMRAGAYGFLTKPFEDEMLLRAIQRATARPAARRTPEMS